MTGEEYERRLSILHARSVAGNQPMITYCAIIPAFGAVRYLVQVLRPSGKIETPCGFTDSRDASAFMAREYPGAIELTPGEFLGKVSMSEAVSR